MDVNPQRARSLLERLSFLQAAAHRGGMSNTAKLEMAALREDEAALALIATPDPTPAAKPDPGSGSESS